MRAERETGSAVWRWFRRRGPFLQGYLVASYTSTLLAILYYARCDPNPNRYPAVMLALFIFSPLGLPLYVVFMLPVMPPLSVAWMALAGLIWAGWATPLYCARQRAAIEARRRQMHLCIHCGYDLRGSPTYICPECGWSSRPQQG